MINTLNKTKILFTLGSPYALLIALLKYGISPDYVYCFNGNVVSIRIVGQLSKHSIVYVRRQNSDSKRRTDKLLSAMRERKRYDKFLEKINASDYRIMGHDHILSISYRFWGKYDTIIEDGYINSLTNDQIMNIVKQKGKRYFHFLDGIYRLKHHGRKYVLYGFDKSIKHIVLTQQKYSDEIAGKVELVSLKELWCAQTDEMKELITGIFYQGSIDIEKEASLLITQPLSEDRLMTEEEKIELYKVTVDMTPNLIIKPHPREKTDYRLAFPDVAIIGQEIPLEILALTLPNIHSVISCFSTAVKIFEETADIKYISLDQFPQIKEKYKLP